MSCLVKLAQGCPTNGGTMMHGLVVCAAVTAVNTSTLLNDLDRFVSLPAHVFAWSKIAVRWTAFEGHQPYWALRNQ